MGDSLWLALALVLVFEGARPLVAPARWRQVFTEILKLHNGQIRFFGLVCVLLGLAGLWWLMPAR